MSLKRVWKSNEPPRTGDGHIPWLEGLEWVSPIPSWAFRLLMTRNCMISRYGSVGHARSARCAWFRGGRITEMQHMVLMLPGLRRAGSNTGQDMLEVLKAAVLLAKTATLAATALRRQV